MCCLGNCIKTEGVCIYYKWKLSVWTSSCFWGHGRLTQRSDHLVVFPCGEHCSCPSDHSRFHFTTFAELFGSEFLFWEGSGYTTLLLLSICWFLEALLSVPAEIDHSSQMHLISTLMFGWIMGIENAATISLLCVYMQYSISLSLPHLKVMLLSGAVNVYEQPVSKALKVIDRLDGSFSHVLSHCLP